MTLERMNTSMAGAITARREALGLSQSALAKQAGVSRAHLNQVETGKIALPSADFRRKLAAALGVPHVQLLVWAGELSAAEAALEDRPPVLADLHARIEAAIGPAIDHPKVVDAIVENIKHTVQMWQDFSQQPPSGEPEPRRNGAAPVQSPAEGR